MEGDTDKTTVNLGDLRLHLELLFLGRCQARPMLVAGVSVGIGVEVRRGKRRLSRVHGFEVERDDKEEKL
jgi:hypothetical protein